jgi:ribosomal protein L11 methyltransferase
VSLPPTGRDYWEVRIPITAETGEGLTNFLWEAGALGVIEESTAAGPACLRAFYPGTAEPAALAERVRAYAAGLTALGFRSVGAPEIVPLSDPDWARAWREHFRPLPVGRRLVLAPPWERATMPGRRVVVIDPGRAFGTGRHPTTRGCLEAVETLIERRRPGWAIDLGTGSGILAIAAVVLGVDRVLAVDSDPDAIAATAANAARNAVGERVQCVLADAASVRAIAAPLVTANLLTAAHLHLAAHYATLLAPEGVLVLGGILSGEGPTVAAALRDHGLPVVESRAIDDWTTLISARGDRGSTPPPGARTPDATVHDRG